MKEASGKLKELVYAVTSTAKVRKRWMTIVAAIVILQLYFVRELIAAELLFGLGFAVMLVVAGIFYLVGAAAERGWRLAGAGGRAMARSARRGYSKLSPVMGAIAEGGWDLAEEGSRAMARSARRGYSKLSPVMGAIAERGWDLAEAGGRAVARSAHRGFNKLEEVSKRQFRHPRSESAP